jgi:hypothetical protein
MTHAVSRTHTHRHTQLHARTHAHTHAHILAASTRLLSAVRDSESPAVVESAADACSIDKSPQYAAAPLFAQPAASTSLHSMQLLHCSHNLNKQAIAANSVQWTLRLLVSDARTDCTGSPMRARLARRGYRFTLFRMRRALLSFGSESAIQDRARKQVQRVADPSSQPPASRRSIGAWWPDEGSALYLEMAYSGGDRRDRMRRGTHDRADAK